MINGASGHAAGLKPTLLGTSHAAARAGGLVLALVTCMMAPPAGLGVLAFLLAWALAWTGLSVGRQFVALRPWLPIALLVIVVHTFTTTAAAPLGHPSVAGVLAGGAALLRLACSIGCLGLYLRVTPLDDLVTGTGWWLQPLRRFGFRSEDFGLMLAVALGTAPTVLREGRRIEAVVTMRRAGPSGSAGTRSRLPGAAFFRRLLDRARLVVPLLETLIRRAEALTLSLRRRRPGRQDGGPVPPLQMAVLLLWAAGLIWWAVTGTGEGAR